MDRRLSVEAHGEYMIDCMRQINARLNHQLNEQVEYSRYTKYLERRNTLLKRIIAWLCWAGIVTFIIIGCARTAKAEEMQHLTASYYSRASLIKEGTAKYNPKFIMANGKVFYDESAVCACNSYPLGAVLCVTNSSGKSVVVVNSDRTNKRFTGKRIDLAISQFAEIADTRKGITSVVVERII
jgi:rare lipoprotein A (peptidoglycan hydrolase)